MPDHPITLFQGEVLALSSQFFDFMIDQLCCGATVPVDRLELIDEHLQETGHVSFLPDDKIHVSSVLDLECDAIPGVEGGLVCQVQHLHLVHMLAHQPKPGSERSIYESLNVIKIARGVRGLQLQLFELLGQELKSDIVLDPKVIGPLLIKKIISHLVFSDNETREVPSHFSESLVEEFTFLLPHHHGIGLQITVWLINWLLIHDMDKLRVLRKLDKALKLCKSLNAQIKIVVELEDLDLVLLEV